jgi:hypothetical protein
MVNAVWLTLPTVFVSVAGIGSRGSCVWPRVDVLYVLREQYLALTAV